MKELAGVAAAAAARANSNSAWLDFTPPPVSRKRTAQDKAGDSTGQRLNAAGDLRVNKASVTGTAEQASVSDLNRLSLYERV